jgi:recombination protein RecT
MSNDNTQVAKKITFGQFLNSTGTQSLIQKTLGDERHAQRFCASILSAVSVTPGLQECDPKTVLSGAFLGDALNLSPSPQLGQFYLVPFGAKNNPYGKVATFIPGYKGYKQLGIRSGQFKRFVTFAVKEGEMANAWNPRYEDVEFRFIEDADKRESAPTVGYFIEIELVNGYRKAIYWTKCVMLNHADRYSPAFKKDAYRLLQEGKIPQGDMWKYSSFWYKDFDAMGKKTMVRQIFGSGDCPMSIDMQMAFDADEKVINPITLLPDADGVYTEPEPDETVPDDAPDFVKEAVAKKNAAKQAKMDEV